MNALVAELALLESVELGVGNGLGDVLLGDGTAGDALERLDGLLSSLADRGSLAGELDGQETGVRVGDVGGLDGKTRQAGGGLGEQAEARSPLDGGLAAEERSENSKLGLGARDVSAREGNDHGVAGGVAGTLLATVVLGGLGLERLAALGRGGQLTEELTGPAGQRLGRGAVSDEGNVGLGVDNVGEAGNVLLVHVLLVGGRSRGVDGGTEARVESDRVGVVQSDGGSIGGESGLLEAEDALNLLVELVGWETRALATCADGLRDQWLGQRLVHQLGSRPDYMLTGVLGQGGDLGKELGEVREVGTEEAGREDEALAGVSSVQLTTEELSLTGNAQGSAALRALFN